MRIPASDLLYETASAPARPALPRRALRAALAWGRAWREERRTLALVARMDRATLKDLGLDRSEIEARLRGGDLRAQAVAQAWRGFF